MGTHPINLAVRFLLELSALFVMGAWGWRSGEGWLRFLLAFGVPLVFAVLWGTFAVPDDPSRSGRAPVPVSGVVRLILELLFFVVGVWMLYDIGYGVFGAVFGGIVMVHYLLSYDRVGWLMER